MANCQMDTDKIKIYGARVKAMVVVDDGNGQWMGETDRRNGETIKLSHMSYSHIASPRHDQEFQHPYRIFMNFYGGDIIDGHFKMQKR